MSTQPSDSIKASILSHILQSPGFQESKRHQELLQYLVERSSGSASVKETEIAQDVFGKDSKFDPATDPLIRSYISNLRKKLEHYYLTNGVQFGYKLEIPKGHYVVRYTEDVRPQLPARADTRPNRGLWSVIAVLSAVIVILVYRDVTQNGKSATDTKAAAANPIWREFTQPNGRPTLIVLGDFFFLRERNKTDGYYRTIKINSVDDYLEYISKDPEFGKKYTKNNFTYLRPSAPWGLMEILPQLQSSPNGFALKLASQFSSDDFKSNNVIFIGSFKTLHLLNTLLLTFKLVHTSSPSRFYIQDGKSDSVHWFIPERLNAGSLENDYGVVAKGPGPDGSAIMMLLGFSESGVIQATHAVTDPQLLHTIAGKFPSGPPMDPARFTLVIEAKGITQSLFEADIKYVVGLGAAR